jgi:5-formyltetrahydrofolate cyclo-ligase
MRRSRRALTATQQRLAAERLCQKVFATPQFLRAKAIALYLPNDGEIDPTPIIKRCWALGKRTYLPVLHPIAHNRLWFIEYTAKTAMTKNCYGILEPKMQHLGRRAAWSLDLVLLPLVAFDAQGNRMGMGGGYYDRSFSFKRIKGREQRPALIGLAHELQRVEQLPIESWDIPLCAIATDHRIYKAH